MPSRIHAALTPFGAQAPRAPQTPNLGDIYRQEGLLAAILQAFSPQALIQLFAQDPALAELPGPSPLAVKLPPNLTRMYRMQKVGGEAFGQPIFPEQLNMPNIPGGRFFTDSPQYARNIRSLIGTPQTTPGYFVDIPKAIAEYFRVPDVPGWRPLQEFVLPPWIAQQATRVRRNVQQVPTNIPRDIPMRLP